jgi:oligoribonuclease (3'-5' exoribonuclease)
MARLFTSRNCVKIPLATDAKTQMTGPNPEEEHIEIFCILTHGDLNVIDKDGWGTVIHQPKEWMDKWCTRTHGVNRLTADEFYAYITKLIPKKGVALLAGDCVYFDGLRKEPSHRSPAPVIEGI